MNHQSEVFVRELFRTAQHNQCPICLLNLEGKVSLDHSHKDGSPHGLLHQKCNLKVAIVEVHARNLPYTLSKPVEARINAYLANPLRLSVVGGIGKTAGVN